MMNESPQQTSDLKTFTNGSVDPTLQQMLSAAGRDQFAVHDVVAGADGNTANNNFIKGLVTHQFADGGAAAGNILHGMAPVAVQHDLLDPTQHAMATRSGETMHAIDQYIATHSGELTHLGQTSPELTKAVAEASAPYISDMTGNPLTHTSGYAALDDPVHHAEMTNTRELFRVLDSNNDAAKILNTRADLDALQYRERFVDSIAHGNGPTSDLQSEEALRGVIAHGSNEAANDLISDKNLAAQHAYEQRGNWLEDAKTVAKQIPAVGAVLDKIPDNMLKQLFVGDAPTPEATHGIAIDSGDTLQHSLAQQLLNSNVGDSSRLTDFIDPSTGQLYTLDQMVQNHDGTLADFRTAVQDYFYRIDGKIPGFINTADDAYMKSLSDDK